MYQIASSQQIGRLQSKDKATIKTKAERRMLGKADNSKLSSAKSYVVVNKGEIENAG